MNNAGVYGPKGPIEEIDWSEWVQAIQINLFGTVLMCRTIIPHFRSRGYGKIINLSGGGATNALPRLSAYAASKAAVVRMTDTLAEELKDANVDVNAIAPGALNTRLLDEVLEATKGAKPSTSAHSNSGTRAARRSKKVPILQSSSRPPPAMESPAG